MKNNLRTLEILQYVYGAFELLGALIVFFLFNSLGTLLQSDFVAHESHGDHAPAVVGGVMSAVGWVVSLFIFLFGVLNIISGRNIGKRRGRTFSMVIAGIDCLNFPFGTALGVFALIELSKEDVKRLYSGEV
ncbi:MAG: hypothetical protein ABI599_05895 [Flavobacteriales bacterium]